MNSFLKVFFLLIFLELTLLLSALFFSQEYPPKTMWAEMESIRQDIGTRKIKIEVGDSVSFERDRIQVDITRPYDLSYPYKLAKYDVSMEYLDLQPMVDEDQNIWQSSKLYVEMADLQPYQNEGVLRIVRIEKRKGL